MISRILAVLIATALVSPGVAGTTAHAYGVKFKKSEMEKILQQNERDKRRQADPRQQQERERKIRENMHNAAEDGSKMWNKVKKIH